MAQDDCIAVLLGLPELRIFRQKRLGDRFEVKVIVRRYEVSCLDAGRRPTRSTMEGSSGEGVEY